MNGLNTKKFAEYLPFILIITSIGGILMGGFYLSRWDYSIRGLAIAIPFIVAAVLLNRIFKSGLDWENYNILFQLKPRTTLVLFSIFYTISIILLILKIDRLWYFLIIVGLYSLVMIQIFSKNHPISSMLGEICLIMVNVIYGVTFSYPIFFRTSDVMSHIFLAKVTFLSGHVIPLDLSAFYSPFPLYHIFIAECSNLLNLPIQETLFLITCPIYVVLILFLYKLFEMLSNDSQVSILACLFYSISNIVLTRGIEMVTSVTAFIGFVILLYLIFKLSKSENHKFSFQCLAFIIIVFLIFVHQVSILQIAILMVILTILEYFFAEKRYFSTSFILFTVVFFLAYWVFYAFNFIRSFVLTRLDVNLIDLGTKNTIIQDPTMSQNTVAILYLYNNIDITIIAFFAIIGIGFILWRQKPKYLAVIGLFSLVTLVLYLPTPLSTTEVVSHLFRIDRFMILLSPFIAFVMAYGLTVLINFLQKNQYYKKIGHTLIILTILIFILSSLSSVILTDSLDHRLYFNSEELNGFNFILDFVPYGSSLQSDYYTSRFFIQEHFSLTDELKLPYYNSGMLEKIENQPEDCDYTIIRESAFKEGGLELGSIGLVYNFLPTLINEIKLANYENNRNKIYSNYFVSITC